MLAVTKVLLSDPLPPLEETIAPDRSTAKTISDVRRVHASHWECFQTRDASASTSNPSHRTSTTTTQRKRKRKNSDTEYTPHRGAENSQSTTTTVRRASKRLAVSEKLERQPTPATVSNTSSSRSSAKRSSSSTSALTSASSSSFDRLPTPKDLDTSDLPVSTSKHKPRAERPPSSESDRSVFYPKLDLGVPVKIGPPRRGGTLLDLIPTRKMTADTGEMLAGAKEKTRADAEEKTQAAPILRLQSPFSAPRWVIAFLLPHPCNPSYNSCD